ncbi:glycosyl hydrolase 115 family protein [Gracilibacillus sp. S3-1-1]|uniref:Glycosyl hydrolase 115 family protein n=1 Tax=Gracilibacillus pellucidus TaxID=3095368 RepID=A0ACC6M3Q8_9BACI|nr:glycosyl hydrolase 115 family protein [Gracilibacillus sp. S3-1-1]MDX8045595.1 glycosyl hydrolase 115 family protein [Gracilibacillus sp. S3-1-1]
MDYFHLNDKTKIRTNCRFPTPIQYAVDILKRDMGKVLDAGTRLKDDRQSIIEIGYVSEPDKDNWEQYIISFSQTNGMKTMHVQGNDELGIIYGVLYVSKVYLNIDPYWFWADLSVQKKDSISIPMKQVISKQPKVRYRGWFVNDEVCLIGWKKEYPPTREVWLPVFEALLRLGGNMVIPGTDLPRHGIHFELASELGLWITHHHAEPLGAEMFKRAFPDKQASYTRHQDLYESLWEEAIQQQKDKKVIWVLSFRGQGDEPFWKQDSSYDTPEKRGELISNVIAKQLHLVKNYVEEPVCCVALYGEISELYKSGNISLPDGIIKVWADNGYGKMVSRRNGNEDFRIPSVPEGTDQGKQGLYYHVTFHDLQASNHLTMFPSSPSIISRELENAIQYGGDDYLLVNAGNIRMHLYSLELVSEIWKNGKVDTKDCLTRFIKRLYSSHHQELSNLYHQYFECTILYGEHEDNRAGEQFYHHPVRKIISHWIQGKYGQNLPSLNWVTGDRSFSEQVQWLKEKCEDYVERWSELMRKCEQLHVRLNNNDKQRFADQLIIQVKLHESGCKGFIDVCTAFHYFREKKYPEAFVYASEAIWHYQKGYEAMRLSEHGKWKDFYKADWLTNVESTIQNVDTLRKFIRMYGDSPDFFLWYKKYLMPEKEKYIYLENTHRKPLTDDELAKRLKEVLF